MSAANGSSSEIAAGLPARVRSIWSVLWLWAKVISCLLLVDILLFRVGWLWRVNPKFGTGMVERNWNLLFTLAEHFETGSRTKPTAFVVGSSVVFRGIHEGLLTEALAQRHLPIDALRVTSLGASCTDSSLLVWSGMHLHPWLVIYGAASRDFGRLPLQYNPVVHTFYDSSVELPSLPRIGIEAQLDATVKRYWKLYRYRFFARTALTTLLGEELDSAAIAGEGEPVVAAGNASLPEEANRRFGIYDMTPESYQGWERWYRSRRVSDYLAWVESRSSEVLRVYAGLTLANYGPIGNPNVRSLEWMLRFLQHANARAVIVYFPENPIFREPEARKYFDPALSEEYAGLFAREAVAHGARFVDLRNMLPPEDFYDLIHVNLIGMGKVSARIAEIVEEEWRAHEAQAASDQEQAAQ